MIFLNKTCFNGLWRVNARGEFNVPVGSHENPGLYDRENILAASRALEGVHLATQDFRDTLNETRRDDFAYVDPPYYPVSPPPASPPTPRKILARANSTNSTPFLPTPPGAAYV